MRLNEQALGVFCEVKELQPDALPDENSQELSLSLSTVDS